MMPSISELTNRFLARHTDAPAPDGPVEPYDVSTAFRVEPRLAWSETHYVMQSLGLKSAKMPSEWATHVRAQHPVRFIPMAIGFYPQMVSDLALLLDGIDNSPSAEPFPWTGDTNDASTINNAAVKSWLQSDWDHAEGLWQSLPSSVVKTFNLGLIHLHRRQNDKAIQQLSNAISHIPDSSGWKSLAELYSSLARGEA